MHQIKPAESAVTLFSRDGVAGVYPSMKVALAKLGYRWIADNVGADFRRYSHTEGLMDKVWGRHAVYTEAPFIMRGDFGVVLTAADFWDLRELRKSRWTRRYGTWNGSGPVPRTGRWTHRRWMRRIHTTPERRWAAPIKEEGEVAPRAARNASNIPNSWDDYVRDTREARGWKRNRAHQWKE